MEYYRKIQYGHYIMIPMLVVAVTFFVIGVHSSRGALTATGVFFLFLCSLFFRLVIVVHAQRLTLYYGIGLIRKTIDLNRVKAARAVRNQWWYGWGLRMYPGGWLYNISGLDAVELTMEKKPHVRIGTADPVGLTGAIQARLDTTPRA
jgi:hypothetical protein